MSRHAVFEEECMSKKVIVIIAIGITALLLFTACVRSVSQPILATAIGESTNSTLQSTPLNALQEWGTSTAMFLQTAEGMGLNTPIPTSETPQPGLESTLAVSLSTPIVPPAGVATATPLPGTTTQITPAVAVPTTSPGRPATYTLRAGDFPYCIARRFDVNPGDLMTLNGLSQGEILQPGKALNIPQTGTFPGNRVLTTHPATYTVNAGDTLNSIACHFGDVDPASIAVANSLSLASQLTTGQILNIP
jgi:LysM repeat protein